MDQSVHVVSYHIINLRHTMTSLHEDPDQLKLADVETWKRILAELSLESPSEDIRNCLKVYDPEKPTKQNTKMLKSCKKGTIIKTLEFLSKQSVDENTNKEDIVQKLCLKIQNYFPDICQICNSSYTFNFHDKAFMQCVSCGQEVHKTCYLKLLKGMNLIDEKEAVVGTIFNIPGICYLCPACQQETVNFPFKIDDNVSNHSEENDNESLCQETTANHTPRRALPITPKVIIDKKNKTLPEFVGRTDFLKKKFQNELDSWSKVTSEDTTNNYEDMQKNEKNKSEASSRKNESQKGTELVCKYYKKGRCKHGLKGRNCNFLHPKACPKLMKFGNKGPNGCKQGVNCPNFHPRMCATSLRYGECLVDSCTFTHIKGTKRKVFQSLEEGNKQSQQSPQNFQSKENDFLPILEKFKSDILQEMDVRIARMTPPTSTLMNHNQNNQMYQYSSPYPCQTQQQEWIQPQHQQWEMRKHPISNC